MHPSILFWKILMPSPSLSFIFILKSNLYWPSSSFLVLLNSKVATSSFASSSFLSPYSCLTESSKALFSRSIFSNSRPVSLIAVSVLPHLCDTSSKLRSVWWIYPFFAIISFDILSFNYLTWIVVDSWMPIWSWVCFVAMVSLSTSFERLKFSAFKGRSYSSRVLFSRSIGSSLAISCCIMLFLWDTASNF